MSYLKPGGGGALLQAESISFLVLYIIFLFQHLFVLCNYFALSILLGRSRSSRNKIEVTHKNSLLDNIVITQKRPL